MESGDTTTLFEQPMHPYTWGLMQSVIRLDQADKPLNTIPGAPIDQFNMTDQCQ
ncbi:MAG: hypothetical protein MK035_00530 [Dehalococcoidia bacterium]|nr:hypothetical protein [Dehalococcoidia bacterium]